MAIDSIEAKMFTLVPDEMSHRAPYHLLTSIAAPRPIAWDSTINRAGELFYLQIPNLDKL